MITTNNPQKEMEKLNLCTKHVHFSYDGKICKQFDGVSMGTPLGSVLANMFMAELEITMIHSFGNYLKNWK